MPSAQAVTDEVSVRHPHAHRRPLTPDEAADLAAELDEQEFEERVEPICVAPVPDGSRSLSEAAHELHAFAVWLVEMEEDGWQPRPRTAIYTWSTAIHRCASTTPS